MPSFTSYSPYAQYLDESKGEMKNPYECESRILENLNDSKEKNKYFFEVESVQSEEKQMELEELKESKIEHREEEPLERSVAWSFDVLFG